ncbi:MAG: hypothetical protein ACRENE_10775 [Polyangiaceae bacterium]
MISAAASTSFQAHVVVVRDAAKVVLRHLNTLPLSPERDRLYATVHDCTRAAEQWGAAPPSRRDVDALMKRLLEAHVQVARLEYHRSIDESGGPSL